MFACGYGYMYVPGGLCNANSTIFQRSGTPNRIWANFMTLNNYLNQFSVLISYSRPSGRQHADLLDRLDSKV